MNLERAVSREAPGRRFARRGMGLSREGRAACSLALATAFLGLAACGGARHRKVNGPPPEYELPDESGAADSGVTASSPVGTGGGTAVADGGVTPSTGGAR
ncbi:MAG: hypothetical protein ABW133_23625 [Polyangiaceae bacterium]